MTSLIQVHIDGQTLDVAPGTTIWQAAKDAGIEIPVLCHSEKLDPVGVCRMCVVDVGERVLAASCVRECQDGMTVETASPKVEQHRKVLTELLLDEHPTPCEREQTTGDCELEALGRRYGVRNAECGVGNAEWAVPDSAFDTSSPVIAVDHSACILCDRCVRACDDIQSNEVIGRSGKGFTAQIAFDLNNPMGESTCVSCGECVSSCPTGALTPKMITLPLAPRDELTSTDSVCPYCGVGCAVTFHTREGRIVLAEGRESPVNQGRLCVKGR